MRAYVEALRDMPALAATITANMARQREAWQAVRREAPLRVGVCGWSFSHNPSGRAHTLALVYQRFAPVELVGALYFPFGREVWEPIRHDPIPRHLIAADGWGRFLDDAFDLVASHPYDLVHLSKPRAPNILMGLLYRLLWGARVWMDIDDEELAFAGGADAVALLPYLAEGRPLPPLDELSGPDWTRIAVGLAREFDGVTVSNRALQQRYGGEIVGHARDEALFQPSESLRLDSRRALGIAPDRKVVLFLGTPRAHKGLLELARAIASLDRDDLLFTIVGEFPEPALKAELQAIEGVALHFIGNVPISEVPRLVAIADACVLLQDVAALAARFQIPAKLTDALAMGVPVIASATPALADVFAAGAAYPAPSDGLPAALTRVIDDAVLRRELRQRGRRYFENFLSVGSSVAVLQQAARVPARPLGPSLRALVDALGDRRLIALAATGPAPAAGTAP